MKKVVFAVLGNQLDSGLGDKRWNRWRPTVALGDPALGFDRIELLISRKEHLDIAKTAIEDIKSLNPGIEVKTHVLEMKNPWDFAEVYETLDDFAKGYSFSNEEYSIHLVTGTHVAQICMFLLAESKRIPAKLMGSMPLSRVDQSAPAWKAAPHFIDLNLSNYDRLASRFKKDAVESETLLKGGIKTLNPQFNELIKRVEKVCLKSSEPILITGPTGSGKTALAGRIYELRHKKNLTPGKFVEINCATLSRENAMSTLFGHRKGAFTGAISDREGLLKAADKGVLMLDEIGTLGLDEQAMLLRAIEDKRFSPLGSDQMVESNFQIIAGTNLDIEEEVREGRFRADLLSRINLWSFRMPGLSERSQDIEPNIDYELEMVGQRMNTVLTMSKEARERYLSFAKGYTWPGNFRELHSSIVRMATLAEGSRITLDDVNIEFSNFRQEIHEELEMDLFDKVQLDFVIDIIKKSESMADAGRILFGVSRTKKTSSNDSHRLKVYLEKFGLDFKEIKQNHPISFSSHKRGFR